MSQQEQSPSDYKLLLGEELTTRRKDADKTRVEAAEALGCSEAKIGTIERGRSAISLLELRGLLALYDVPAPQRAEIEALALNARKRRPPTPWGSTVPPRLKQYFHVEETAREIRHHHTFLLHGLVQTEDYARAVIGHNRALRPAEVERLVEARMARQAWLKNGRPTRLTEVVPEAVLRSRLGGGDVMRGQLAHLTDLVSREVIDLRVVPIGAGMYSCGGYCFTILTRAAEQRSAVVYLENLTDGVFVDDETRVEQYETAFAEMLDLALSPEVTLELLTKVAAEL
ncbi:helix-turn-helix domain-containing protein [Umezawaea tangerina]|uniref:Helix-turn-helix protein n=1 Tax=Umezawaea tangerina TaxID=84725 RepID=A0A2T0TCQ6_9PSEU|nr:helix-turn-helix transcriptional regulator [Umezawaea tangerina]PRY43452.1 helix-turn-helix protein [Umezawaea tangerina]